MLKQIISDFKDAYEWIKECVFLRRCAFRLKLAIRLADMKQQAFNKRYFVVLAPNNKLIAINNDDIDRLKRLKLFDKRMGFLELQKKCFYYTALSLNNKMSKEQMQEAKQRYIQYSKKYKL